MLTTIGAASTARFAATRATSDDAVTSSSGRRNAM